MGSSIDSQRRRRIINQLTERDGFVCHYCGVSLAENPQDGTYLHNAVSLDHVVAQKLGGDHSIENLVLCCRRCNSRKNKKDYGEFRLVTEIDGMILWMMETDE